MAFDYLRALAGLFFCLGLVVGLAALARRYKAQIERLLAGRLRASPQTVRLAVIERRVLVPGHIAVIVSVDGVEHAAILSPQSSTLLPVGAVR